MDSRLLGKLARASLDKAQEPNEAIDWSGGIAPAHPVLAVSALSLWGTPILEKLSGDQRARLARNEVASVFSVSIRFEDTLIRTLARYVEHADPLEPGLDYYLHVVEEEARHNRMFIRLIDALGEGGYPTSGVLGFVQHRLLDLVRSTRCLFFLGVLAVEEVTDRLFATWLDYDETHDLVTEVCRLHRTEEARHRTFSSQAFSEAYGSASWVHRRLTAIAAPAIVNLIFDVLVPPSVYIRSGLAESRTQAWRLWLDARQSEQRAALRRLCAQPVLRRLREAGAIDRSLEPLWAMWGLPRALDLAADSQAG